MLLRDLVYEPKWHLFLEKNKLNLYKKIYSNKDYLLILNLIFSLKSFLFKKELTKTVIEIFTELGQEKNTQKIIKEIIYKLMPWKKGPFKIDRLFIDSEWQSNLKWDRITYELGEIQGKNILDLGCNNGYFMFKLLPKKPQIIVGLDPTALFYMQYFFLAQLIRSKIINFLFMGYEDLRFFYPTFDCVLCLGILYHHSGPIDVLKSVYGSLKWGGKVLVDCQGILEEKPQALFPEKRYAGKNNFWFLPSKTCLIHWVKRAGFKDVKIFYSEKLSFLEQRKTKFYPAPSLKEGFKNEKETLEGYSLPYRFYLTAVK